MQSLPLILGGMSMRFDETLINEKRTEIILKLLDDIRNKIINAKDYLTGDHLNSLRKTIRYYLVDQNEFVWNEKEIQKQLNEGSYGEELPFENYNRGFDLLSKLIAGQLNIKVDTDITYWDD